MMQTPSTWRWVCVTVMVVTVVGCTSALSSGPHTRRLHAEDRTSAHTHTGTRPHAHTEARDTRAGGLRGPPGGDGGGGESSGGGERAASKPAAATSTALRASYKRRSMSVKHREEPADAPARARTDAHTAAQVPTHTAPVGHTDTQAGGTQAGAGIATQVNDDQLADWSALKGSTFVNPRPTTSLVDTGKTQGQKNVVFFMVDDLRPTLSVYNVSHVITPNFERLARMSTLFERAYTQDPICNPSRNSLMREFGGYKLYGSGKLEHWQNHGMEFYEEYFPASTHEYLAMTDGQYSLMTKASVLPDDKQPLEEFPDHRIATKGIEFLERAGREYREEGQPFFLGVGFHQPHRPWHFPKQYWDLYEGVPVEPAPDDRRPKDSPNLVVGDINPNPIKLLPDGQRQYTVNLNQEHPVPEAALREQMRGYHAGITWTDSQMGRVLDALKKEGLLNDTVIVLTADHGLNVGDHGLWDKRTLLETTSRIPIFIRDPTRTHTQHTRVHGLVENVDIFPTVIDILGLQEHAQQLHPPLDGTSLVPVMESPTTTLKDYALTQIARCCNGCAQYTIPDVPWQLWKVCTDDNRRWEEHFEHVVMGYSLRTDQWRYTLWVPWDAPNFKPRWDRGLQAEELYDRREARCNTPNGFDVCDEANVAGEPEFADIKSRLNRKLVDLVKGSHVNRRR